MGLLSKLGEIVLDQPAVRDAVGQAVTGLFEGFRGRPALTKKERKEGLRKLIPQLTSPDFEDNFENQLAYYASLLGTIVETVDVAERGCIVEEFFWAGHCFYFPPPAGATSLEKGKLKGSNDEAYGVRVDDADFYHFYAFTKKDGGLVDASAVKAKLDEVAQAPSAKGESRDFRDWLEGEGYKVTALSGVSQNPQTKTREFVGQIDDPPMPLNYKNKKQTKQALKDLLGSHLGG